MARHRRAVASCMSVILFTNFCITIKLSFIH